MRRLLPDPFERRERWLTALAMGMAALFSFLTFATSLTEAAYLMGIALGTLLPLFAAGHNRCFFTALFTGLLSTAIAVVMLVRIFFIDQESLNRGDAEVFAVLYGIYVAIPTAFAWLVTFILRIIKRLY